ncbi:MAG: polysaccharide pyruvyl transferase family protein [Clostridia bacterium]|nr:polysaccharide pyruvyl transferase family protein [Clostridia bacterium]
MKIYLDAYLSKNLGDDLFIDILLKRYPNHKYVAISKGEKYNIKNLKVYRNSYFYRAIKKFAAEKYIANKCDLVITIGGSMYIENNDSNRDFTLGKNKRYILGSNFGPYQTNEYLKNLHSVFKNAEDVCFREEYSYNLFKDLPNVRYAQDIVFSLDVRDIKITKSKRAIISVIDCKSKLDEKYQGIYEQKLVDLIEYLFEKDYKVCLMSFCKAENDELAINRIINKLDEKSKNKIEKYFYNGNIEEALNNIGNSSVVIGSRFHAIILGLLMNKAVLPIIYSNKTKNVLEENNIDVKIFNIKNINEFNPINLEENDFTKIHNIDHMINSSQNQFKQLDTILK